MPKSLSNYAKIMLALLLASISGLGVSTHSARADAPPNTAMPLPDLITYGSVTVDGEQAEAGTVKALLPRGDVISVPLESIDGTEYEYVLPIPLSMYKSNSDPANFASDSAVTGEAIHFFINDRPALFKDANGMTVDKFVVPTMGMGTGQVLDLLLAGPDRFASGDVNANGLRDSADGMLVLKHDIGLIPGGEVFPPPPGMIYTPLCDIVEDGQCNSSDALRILQCDVGLTTVGCPQFGVQAASLYSMQLADDANVAVAISAATAFDEEQSQEIITIRLQLVDPMSHFGAASLTLFYDNQQMTLLSCNEVLNQPLDMNLCNPDFGAGLIRLNGVTSTALVDQATLAEFTFLRSGDAQSTGSVAAEVSDLITIIDGNVYDLEGKDIVWRIEQADPQVAYQPTDIGDHNTEELAPNMPTNFSIFLPLLNNQDNTRQLQSQSPSGTVESADSQQPSDHESSSQESSGQESSGTDPQQPIDIDNRIYLPAINVPTDESIE